MWIRATGGEIRNLGLAKGFDIVETATEGEFQLVADNDVGVIHTGTESECERVKNDIENQLLGNGLPSPLQRY